jgi:triphosphatase
MPRRVPELRLELGEADVERFRVGLPSGELTAGPVSREKRHTVYFDTADHALRTAGLTLNLRRKGKGWVQTVEAEQNGSDDNSSGSLEPEIGIAAKRPDIEAIPNTALRRAVQTAVNGGALLPIFETLVEQTTRTLTARGSEIILVVDHGEVRAGQAVSPLREAELDLKSGRAEDLLFAAEALFSDCAIGLSTRSRAERGYEMLDPPETDAKPDGQACKIRIRPGDTTAEAFVAILAAAARQIEANREGVLRGEDPEAAHQLRVGLRRLRSALWALRPAIGSDPLRTFEQAARDLGQRVSPLRDADVILADIVAPVEALAPENSGFQELRDILVRDRERKRAEVRDALRGAEWARLQLYLTVWPRILADHPKLGRNARTQARKALNRAWRRVTRYGANLDRLTLEERHEMRKALKKLRYQVEFFLPIADPRAASSFLEQLKALQDVFGYLNDVRLAHHLVDLPECQSSSSAAGRAIGYVIGRHEAKAEQVWQRARKCWKKLARTPLFWV